jgi:hypothetical protein
MADLPPGARRINPVNEPFLCGLVKPSANRPGEHICNTIAPAGGHQEHKCCCGHVWRTPTSYIPVYAFKETP